MLPAKRYTTSSFTKSSNGPTGPCVSGGCERDLQRILVWISRLPVEEWMQVVGSELISVVNPGTPAPVRPTVELPAYNFASS